MSYRISLWDDRRTNESDAGLSEQPFHGTQDEAVTFLEQTVDSGQARLGQVLAEDGLVLKTYARRMAS